MAFNNTVQKLNKKGKILSEVFRTSTIIQDSSWNTKYQFIQTKYTVILKIFKNNRTSLT